MTIQNLPGEPERSFPLTSVGVTAVGCDPRLPQLLNKLAGWGVRRFSGSFRYPDDGLLMLVVAPAITSRNEERTVDAFLRRDPSPPLLLLLDPQHTRDYLARRSLRHVIWLDTLTQLSLRRAASRAAASGTLEGIWSEVLDVVTTECPDWICRRAVRELYAPPPPPASVTDLAHRIGCSPRHLSRRLRDMGVCADSLVRWGRLMSALLLRKNGLKWGDVAKEAGFGSQSGLSHFVKVLTDHTPSELEAKALCLWQASAAQAIRINSLVAKTQKEPSKSKTNAWDRH